MYDKYSKNLKIELNQNYIKRAKIDNNWQYRVMNSKLYAFEEEGATARHFTN